MKGKSKLWYYIVRWPPKIATVKQRFYCLVNPVQTDADPGMRLCFVLFFLHGNCVYYLCLFRTFNSIASNSFNNSSSNNSNNNNNNKSVVAAHNLNLSLNLNIATN